MKGKKNGNKQRIQQSQTKVSLYFDNLQLKKFYNEELIHLIHPCMLSKVVSIIIIIISRLTVMSFVYKDEIYYSNGPLLWQKYNEQRLQNVANYVQYLQVFPLIEEHFQTINPYYFTIFTSFVLNILFVSALVFSFLLRNFEVKNIKQQFQKFCQFYTTIHNQWLFYISLNSAFKLISLKDLQYPLDFISISYLNIFLTIGIGLLIEMHDFSCSFKEESNYLAKQSDNTFIFLLILRAIIIILNSFSSHKIIVLFSTLYFLIETLFILFKDYYLSDEINQIYFCLSAASFQICICFLVENFVFQKSDIILISIVTLPISITFVLKYNKNKNEQLFHTFLNIDSLYECNAYQFLKIIRLILHQSKLCQNHYLYKGQGINYQAIIQVHELQCISSDKSCFCYLYRAPDNQHGLLLQELTERHFRKQYIEHILLDIMEKYIQNTKVKQAKKINILRLSLLNYLFEIVNDPTKALISLYRTQFQFILNNKIRGVYMFYFYQLKELVMKSYQEILFESNIENQKINMIGAILFDEKINICKKQLRATLIQTGDFYDLLCANFIPLKQLEMISVQIMSLPLINLNRDLEQNFIELFSINPKNFDLQYLACIYIQTLDFQNRKIKEFQDINFKASQQKNHQKKKLNQIHQQIEKSGILFMSLIEKEFIIKKASKILEKIFGYNSELLKGKELNILIPNLLKMHHNNMIQSFINEQSMGIINLGERNIFGQDHYGFVFPISLRIKIQLLENDFGVCALIEKNKNFFSYIFFENEGRITDVSKKIFFDIFQPTGFQDGYQLNIFDLIPSLDDIIKAEQSDKYVSSIMVIEEPKVSENSKWTSHEKFILSQTKIKNNSSQNSEVFHIQYRFLKHTTLNKVNINFVEIDFYQKETDYIQKKKILDQLNKQYYNKIQQSFQKIQSQQTSECINSLQQQYFSTNSQLFENQDKNPIKSRENQKDHLRIFQKYQALEKSVSYKADQNPSLLEAYEPPSLQHDILNQKQSQDINFFQITENQSPKTSRSSELKYLHSQRILDEQNNEILFQTINNVNKIPKNPFEQSKMILSPTVFSQERQEILINQSNEQKDIFLKYAQQIKPMSQNHQEISFNYDSSQQYLNKKFTIRNNSNIISKKTVNITKYLENPFLEEQHLRHNFKNINKKIRNKNFKEQEEMNEQFKNEIVSVNSSKYSTEEFIKKKMIQRIKKTKFTLGLQLISFTGVAAFAILSIVSLIIYFQNLNSLDSFLQSFLKIDDALFCFIDVMNIVGLNNYQSVLGYNQYLIIDSLDLQNYEYNQTDLQQQELILDFNANLKQLVLGNESGDQLDELQKNMFQVQIYAAEFYNDARVQQNSTTNFQQSLQYVLMEFLYEITFYYIHYEEQQEDFIWGNIYNFKQRMENLQLIVENYAKDQFNNINLYQIFAIILFATISVVLIFSIMPLNIIIQLQKEKILKLFGSFSPSIIEQQIKQIELSLYKMEQISIQEQTNNSINTQTQNQKKQINDLKFKYNLLSEAQKQEKSLSDQVPKYIQRQLDKRSRQIASFSIINKFNLVLFLFGMAAVALLLVMPILNIFVFNPFQAEEKITLQDRISLIDVFSLIIENFCAHMEQIFLISIGTSPSTSYYQTYLQNIQNTNQQSFQYLQQLTEGFDVQRKDQVLFVDFYQNLFISNVCQVRQNYPQYFNSNITESNCNSIFNGILQRGLILSVQKVFQIFQEMYQIYSIQDFNEVTNQFIYFQTQYSFIQFKQLIQDGFTSFTGLKVNFEILQIFSHFSTQIFYMKISTSNNFLDKYKSFYFAVTQNSQKLQEYYFHQSIQSQESYLNKGQGINYETEEKCESHDQLCFCCKYRRHEQNQTNYQQQEVLQDYKFNLQKLVLINHNQDQLNELQNNLFQVNIYGANTENYNQDQQNSIKTYEFSLQYTLMELLQQITFYYLNYEDSQEDFIWGNIYNFKQTMKDLQLIVQNNAKKQFNNMDIQQSTVIILFVIICALLIFSVLPLYCVIQAQKENIFKFFGTFSPCSIEFQIKQIEFGLHKIDQMKILDKTQQIRKKYENRSNNQVPRYIQRQLNKRKRRIESFNNIPKLNLVLIFIGIIAAVLLLVIPIVSLIIFDPFEEESKTTLKDRIQLIDTFSLIIENFSSHMEQVFLISINSSPQSSNQYLYLQNIQSQIKHQYNNFSKLAEVVGVQRNDQEMFANFYLGLLKQNVCKARQNYPQYFKSNITESQCNNLLTESQKEVQYFQFK
ncbi:hypothetical protein ABPG72_022219 [Tetrahymena utriculariae]